MTLSQTKIFVGFRRLLLALCIGGFISLLAACGGELQDHDHEHAVGEVIENEQDALESAVEEAVEVTEDVRLDMEGMSLLPADMIFVEGSVEYSIKGFIENGTGEQVFILDKIPMEGEDVSLEGKEQLDKLAALLKTNPDVNCEVQGHTAKAKNAVGGAGKKTWSKARAMWVKAKLNLRGADGDQLTAKGYSDEQLLADLDPEADGQKRIALLLKKQ
jgi:outer membrane protein OmpA-like peptidoglycan-associated protein